MRESLFVVRVFGILWVSLWLGCSGGSEPGSGVDKVIVKSQDLGGKTLVLDFVEISKPGFVIVVEKGVQNGNGGGVALQPGKYQNVEVTLKTALTKEAKFVVAIVHDDGDEKFTDADKVIEKAGASAEITLKPASHAILEVEDQTLEDNRSVTIKKVFVPISAGAATLAIFLDKDGEPGEFMVATSVPSKGLTNHMLKMKRTIQGKQKLHALLVSKKKSLNKDEPKNNTLLKDKDGNELHVKFDIDTSGSINFVLVEDQETRDAQTVVVKQAMSKDHMVWVVIHRDDNGKPGKILGKKRELNFSRRPTKVQLDKIGKLKDYLNGEGVRSYVKGKEKLHVVLYIDKPQDNKFKYEKGGSDDPILKDKDGKPVTKTFTVTVNGSYDHSQKDSKYFYYQCDSDATRYYRVPTKMLVDCRCAKVVTNGFPICWEPSTSNAKNYKFGKGPGISHLSFGKYLDGRMDPKTKEIYATVWHKQYEKGYDVGLLTGFDTKTNTRRMISGWYYDNDKGFHMIGEGPEMFKPQGLHLAKDGKLYVLNGHYSKKTPLTITRVDSKTGKREIVWRMNEPSKYGHCDNGAGSGETVQYRKRSFAVDQEGNFYLTFSNIGLTRAGLGVTKISKDGKTCSFVTRVHSGKKNKYAGKEIGSGPRPQNGHFRALTYHDGYLYGHIFVNADIYRIDPKTGDRKIIYNNFSLIGDMAFQWDPHRKGFWISGTQKVFFYYEPDTKKMIFLRCPDTPASKDFTKDFYKNIVCSKGTESVSLHSEGYIVADPDDSNILYMSLSGYGIAKYEISTGNSYTVSNQ